MDIMLNNTDITLQLNYKTLELDGLCTKQDTVDNEHSCVDLAEYCEYCQKDSIVRSSNVSSFFILYFIPVEGNAESSLAFGTKEMLVSMTKQCEHL